MADLTHPPFLLTKTKEVKMYSNKELAIAISVSFMIGLFIGYCICSITKDLTYLF